LSRPNKVEQLSRYLIKNGYFDTHIENTTSDLTDNQFASMVLRVLKKSRPIDVMIDDYLKKKFRKFKVVVSKKSVGKIAKTIKVLVEE